MKISKNNPTDRAPRINLAPLKHVHIEVPDIEKMHQAQIGNLSSTGVGILRESLKSEWQDDKKSQRGRLHIYDKIIEVGLEFIHKTQSIIGCRFQENIAQLQGIIARYFQTELSALNLSHVHPRFCKKQPDGEVLWFLGDDNCELYIVEQNQTIQRFNLSLFGNYIEQRQGQPLIYGRIVENEHDAGEMIGYKPSDLIYPEKEMPEEIVENAFRFIQNIHSLPTQLQDQLVQRIVSHTQQKL